MFIRGTSFFILLIFLLSSCTKNERDLLPPDIRIEAPFEEAQFFTGDTLTVRLELSDNQGLGELTLRLRENFIDTYPEDAPSNLFSWDTLMVNRLFGKESTLEVGIPLPKDLEAMPGALLLKVADDSGNESEWQKVRFNILPELDILPPDINLSTESILTLKGNTFAIIGDVTDNQSITKVGLEMKPLGNDAVIFKTEYENLQINYFHIEEFIEATMESGKYNLTVFAFDETNNSNSVIIPVEIQ